MRKDSIYTQNAECPSKLFATVSTQRTMDIIIIAQAAS